MSKYGNQREDIVVGFVKRIKKADGSDGKLFQIFLYEIDDKKQPIVDGSWVDQKGEKHPKYKINGVLTVAESSLMKMAAGETKRCHIYLRV